MLSSRESAAPRECPTVVTEVALYLEITSCTADRTVDAVLCDEVGVSEGGIRNARKFVVPRTTFVMRAQTAERVSHLA